MALSSLSQRMRIPKGELRGPRMGDTRVLLEEAGIEANNAADAASGVDCQEHIRTFSYSVRWCISLGMLRVPFVFFE